MNERTPEFPELVGEDVSPEERSRLEHVHRMIVDSGPLPELPLALQKAPAVEEDPHDASVAFSFLPRRGGASSRSPRDSRSSASSSAT